MLQVHHVVLSLAQTECFWVTTAVLVMYNVHKQQDTQINIQIYFAFYKSTVGKPVGYRISQTPYNVELSVPSLVL
jgi:hypothetical protein